MWKDHLKFSVGQTVQIVRDNKVWNGTVAKIESLSNDPEFPYVLLVKSSGRPNAVGNTYQWDEASLDLFDGKREKLERVIEANFPRRLDVYYSNLSGGAVVLGDNGKLYRVLESGDIESESDPKPYGRRK